MHPFSEFSFSCVTLPYVKQIFAWFLEGQSLHEIARRLDSAKIPTGFMVTGHKKNAKWVPTTVKVILSNPTYVGDKVFGRTTTAIYMGMKTQKTAPKNWTVITDDHEPIVSREDFAAVQTLLDTNEDKCHSVRSETIEERKALVDILDGKVFCADCGGRLHFVRRRNSRQQLYAIHEEIGQCERSMAELENRHLEEKTIEQGLAGRFKGQTELTNEMALAFIDAVYIQPGGQVEIKWKFKDPLAEKES